MAFSSSEGSFVSLFAETSLHGMYTVLFVAAIYSLFGKERRRQRSLMANMIMGLVVLMYLISTTHVSLALYQDLRAFVTANNADTTFEEIGNPLILAQLGMEFSNCLFADTIIIWRAWVLWGRKLRVIAVPITLLLATGAAGFVLLQRISKVDTPGVLFDTVFNADVATWSITFAALTLTTNLLVTSLIAGRIWYHDRKMERIIGRSVFSERYRSLLLLIIESGAVYSLAWILIIVLNVVGSAGVIVMVDIISQLTGIVPTLIVLVVTLRTDTETRREATLSTWHARHGTRDTDTTAGPRTQQGTYALDVILSDQSGGKSTRKGDASLGDDSMPWSVNDKAV